MDSRPDRRPAAEPLNGPEKPGEAALSALMDQSARDTIERRTTPLDEVLADLEQTAQRIEARLNRRG